jgi:hypothetical protein
MQPLLSSLAQNHNAAWREDALRKRPISAGGGGKWKNNFTTHRSPGYEVHINWREGHYGELRSQEAAKTGGSFAFLFN